LSQRPAEEIQCWTHAVSTLSAVRERYAAGQSTDVVGRVNRLISSWPVMDASDLPLDGWANVRDVNTKLQAGLAAIKHNADAEVKAIDEAIEAISVVIALRKADPATPAGAKQQEKRNKRNRGSSPASVPTTPAMTPAGRVTLNVKGDDRSSEGPTPPSNGKKDKSKSKPASKPFPLLQTGRKVAFHPPPQASSAGTAPEPVENTWILAVVVRCLDAGKHKYEVQDAEEPAEIYQANPKNMIPLPDMDAPHHSDMHPNNWPEYPVGSAVLALYPETTCLYRAEVVQGPKETRQTAPGVRVYRLKFEDDDDQVHVVTAQWVVDWGLGKHS